MTADPARAEFPAEAVEGAKAVFRIMGVFAAVTLFWTLFDQKGSSWVFQARRMDLALLGSQLSPAQLQALNPFLVLALIPLFTWGIFPFLERRGTALIISHDRRFLESVAERMIELNRIYPQGVFEATGRYSDFLEAREANLEAQANEHATLANKVRREVEWLRRGPKARTTKAKPIARWQAASPCLSASRTGLKVACRSP